MQYSHVIATYLAFLAVSCTQVPEEREISLADLHDKIEGGWAGQMIGVA